MATILQKDARVLREKAESVKKSDIGSPHLKGIIENMQAAMKTREDAVAIAAPQIGHSLRLFVVSGKVFLENRRMTSEEFEVSKKELPPDQIFINPVITKRSRKKAEMDEGCLSVDGWYGKTRRSEKVTLEALNGDGKKIVRGATGLLAQIFQHETDHLNGVLFIDHATDLWQLSERDKKGQPVTASHEE